MDQQTKQKMIDFIIQNGNDEEVLRCVDEIIGRKESEKKLMSDCLKFLSGKSPAIPAPQKKEPVAVSVFEEPAKEVKEETPPGESAGRIGAATKTAIMAHLKKGPDSVNNINMAINGKPGNTAALLKLLWERKELRFADGKYLI